MRNVPKGKNGLIFLRRRLYYGKQDRKLSDTIVKKENKMKRMMGVLAGALAAAGILCGCGESVDENKPIAEVRAEAAKLDAKQLEAKIEACKKFLDEKKKEADALAKQISEIPLKEMLGEKAKGLKQQVSEITESTGKVTEQMNVYAEELKNKASAK